MRLFIAAALVGLAFIPGAATASCAGPTVEVQPNTVQPGDEVRVRGQYFIDGCDDVGGGNACGAPVAREEEEPMRGVRFELRREGETIDAVQVDADAQGDLEATLNVPADSTPGRYHVVSLYRGNVQERVPVRIQRTKGR